MAEVQIRITVHGRVQGVSFRYHTQQQAKLLGLKGWVKNTPAGTVEALFTGKKETVEQMTRWCTHGPPLAYVDQIETCFVNPVEPFDDFAIR